MPRDGSNVYHIPPGTEGVPDTVIESAKYNTYITDIEQDLNTARPILSGGTGATSADAALAGLGAEKASQIVTNYDSHVFTAGSFSSATSATNPPVTGHAFAGIVYMADSNNLIVEARDLDDTIVPPRMYVRQKEAGVWGLWSPDFDQTAQNTLNDARYVNTTGGDTMAGELNLSISTDFFPQLRLTAVNNQKKYIRATNAGNMEWINNAFSATIMSLSDTGFLSFNNGNVAGSLDVAGAVSAGSGLVVGSGLTVGGAITAGNAITAIGHACRAGLNGSYDGSFFNITNAAALWINSINLGTIAFTSDYRTKKDVSDLPRTWNVVKELRPIKYKQRDFGIIKGDDEERWGFVAHELQWTMIQSAATGSKDAPDLIQSPNPWTVIAALTKALQEAMERIEALEVRV